MKQYRTTRVVTIPSGTKIGLSEKQAGTRASFLAEVDKGIYMVLGTLTFVAGELISLSAGGGTILEKNNTAMLVTTSRKPIAGCKAKPKAVLKDKE